MKKNLIPLVFLLWVFTCDAQTELKINPIGSLFGMPTLSADFRVSEFVSVEPSVGLRLSKSIYADEYADSKGVNYRINGKFYFNPSKGLDRFYAGIYWRGEQVDFTGINSNSGFSYTRSFSAIGFSTGYKWVSKQNIVFDLSLGLGRKINYKEKELDPSSSPSITVITSEEGRYFDGFLRIGIGYRFGARGVKK